MSNKQSLTEKEVLKLIEANKHQDEKPKYNGWLTSNSLLERSFAVMGHLIISYFITLIICFGIMILIDFMS